MTKDVNYEKIIIELIMHFIANEGTDYLGATGQQTYLDLSEVENAKLTELRNKARREIGWEGY